MPLVLARVFSSSVCSARLPHKLGGLFHWIAGVLTAYELFKPVGDHLFPAFELSTRSPGKSMKEVIALGGCRGLVSPASSDTGTRVKTLGIFHALEQKTVTHRR